MASPVEKQLRALPPSPPTPSVQPEAPLLFGWEESSDVTTGSKFYFNRSTGVTRWDRPTAPSIFSDGLPELGPLSETTKITSNPSVPTDEQHAEAHINIQSFSTLLNLPKLPHPKTNIWNQVLDETNNLGGYSNAARVNGQVERVINDILEAMGIRGNVQIRAEVEIMKSRPDFMLILVDGNPIGTIEGKQPGQVAMHHLNILGEVYDQLMHLNSIFSVDKPFAILTSYEEWRICWLNGNELAAANTLPTITPYEKSSPPPPPTLSQAMGIRNLPIQDAVDDSDDEDDGDDDQDRTFCGTDVIPWSDKSLPVVLESVIRKMMVSRQGSDPTVLRLANENTSHWKKAPLRGSLNFDLCIGNAVKKFYFWEDLGHGASGKAFLVSGGTKGAVGVLKFYFRDAERQASYERDIWQKAYSSLLPVKRTVRVVKVMGHTALLMPWFQCPERTPSTLEAVKKTLKEDFMGKGLCHGDVAWRNVGVYRDNRETKAVVFDMLSVRPDDGQHNDWVETAVTSLSAKLI